MKKILFIILTIFIMFSIYKNNLNDELIIPDSSIRIRVIPNSNNSSDIKIKNKVKEYLEDNILPIMNNVNTIEEARELINDNLDNIDININKILLDNNYNKKYYINYGYNYFPKKTFHNKEYEEGYYESLVVTLGDSKGDNWWCVMYPNICLIDKENKEYKSYFKELLDKIF